MPDQYEGHYSHLLTTTDATPVNMFDVQMPVNSSSIILLNMVARRPSTNDTKCWSQAMACKRIGDAANIVGAISNLIDPLGDLGALTWDIQYATTGDLLRVQVKGQAGATINWTGYVDALTIQD